MRIGIRTSCSKVILFVVAITMWRTGLAQTSYGKADFDRVRVIQDFLDAVYPDLRQEQGLLSFQTPEFNGACCPQMEVTFVQCRVGSGVPGGGGPHRPLPGCGNFYGDAKSDFLTILYDPGSRRFPIRQFSAQGKFILSKLDALNEEIKAHPDWGPEQNAEALRQAKPKFGPDDKDALLHAVPYDILYRFSGCRLIAQSATLLLGRVDKGSNILWSMNGRRRDPTRRRNLPCNASFEPFEGKLQGIGGM